MYRLFALSAAAMRQIRNFMGTMIHCQSYSVSHTNEVFVFACSRMIPENSACDFKKKPV